MFTTRRTRGSLAAVLVFAQSAAGCYGGPCADPTAMILINFVIPALFISVLIYVRVSRD